MNGKGDRNRTTNHRQFRRNYDAIRWPNPGYREPDDGEIVATGLDERGAYQEVWSAKLQMTHRVYPRQCPRR